MHEPFGAYPCFPSAKEKSSKDYSPGEHQDEGDDLKFAKRCISLALVCRLSPCCGVHQQNCRFVKICSIRGLLVWQYRASCETAIICVNLRSAESTTIASCEQKKVAEACAQNNLDSFVYSAGLKYNKHSAGQTTEVRLHATLLSSNASQHKFLQSLVYNVQDLQPPICNGRSCPDFLLSCWFLCIVDVYVTGCFCSIALLGKLLFCLLVDPWASEELGAGVGPCVWLQVLPILCTFFRQAPECYSSSCPKFAYLVWFYAQVDRRISCPSRFVCASNPRHSFGYVSISLNALASALCWSFASTCLTDDYSITLCLKGGELATSKLLKAPTISFGAHRSYKRSVAYVVTKPLFRASYSRHFHPSHVSKARFSRGSMRSFIFWPAARSTNSFKAAYLVGITNVLYSIRYLHCLLVSCKSEFAFFSRGYVTRRLLSVLLSLLLASLLSNVCMLTVAAVPAFSSTKVPTIVNFASQDVSESPMGVPRAPRLDMSAHSMLPSSPSEPPSLLPTASITPSSPLIERVSVLDDDASLTTPVPLPSLPTAPQLSQPQAQRAPLALSACNQSMLEALVPHGRPIWPDQLSMAVPSLLDGHITGAGFNGEIVLLECADGYVPDVGRSRRPFGSTDLRYSVGASSTTSPAPGSAAAVVAPVPPYSSNEAATSSAANSESFALLTSPTSPVASAICQDGNWRLMNDSASESFRCLPAGHCRLRSTPSLKVIRTSVPGMRERNDIFENHETAVVRCRSDLNTHTITCVNGQWSPPVGRESCKSRSCGSPPKLPNGDIVLVSLDVGEPVCTQGFELRGSSTVYCHDSKWIVRHKGAWPSCVSSVALVAGGSTEDSTDTALNSDGADVLRSPRDSLLRQLRWPGLVVIVTLAVGALVLTLVACCCWWWWHSRRQAAPKRNRLMQQTSHVDELLHLRRTKPIVIPEPAAHTQLHYTHDRKPIPVTSL